MTMTETRTTDGSAEHADGRVVAIAGPVVDAEFPPGAIPEINTAVEMHVELEGQPVTITGEVAQQIGDNRVRIVSMKATDGLTRGMTVVNTGQGITVPVGDGVLGHIFNVLGQPLDGAEITSDTEGIADRWEIHRPGSAPARAPTSISRWRNPACSRRRRSSSGRWTSRPASGCAWRCRR